ncbi:hypothetical protein HGP16_28360 [Rhizobium sp. P40RR-XXII]|uniref:hypothetical protein n=1 Tax=Rhizobium sp. P40RR-XXII TaxID=2726739 RepID=UPI001457695B|nr:hypothetical protein [Rhizobium sp. P40RR-XXII]NLS20445.1 hypothetical protein [Rhizobium sp. P40RR-XXII]
MSSATSRMVVPTVVAIVALCKVRLVILDFLTLRGSRSQLISVLVVWAALVLFVALSRRMLIG